MTPWNIYNNAEPFKSSEISILKHDDVCRTISTLSGLLTHVILKGTLIADSIHCVLCEIIY